MNVVAAKFNAQLVIDLSINDIYHSVSVHKSIYSFYLSVIYLSMHDVSIYGVYQSVIQYIYPHVYLSAVFTYL